MQEPRLPVDMGCNGEAVGGSEVKRCGRSKDLTWCRRPRLPGHLRSLIRNVPAPRLAIDVGPRVDIFMLTILVHHCTRTKTNGDEFGFYPNAPEVSGEYSKHVHPHDLGSWYKCKSLLMVTTIGTI